MKPKGDRGFLPPYLFESILSGEAPLRVTNAHLDDPVTVMTSRIRNCSATMLAGLHTEEPCARCGEACIIHPETVRMATERMVLCWECGEEIGYAPKEVIMHPLALADFRRKR